MKSIGLMFPKPRKIKKRKRHKESILHQKDFTCYLCAKLQGNYSLHNILHEHHIFGGNPNRSHSEAEGLKVYLCLYHHTEGKEAVHKNKKNMKILHQDGQRAYEETHTRQQFEDLFGESYLDEWEEL